MIFKTIKHKVSNVIEKISTQPNKKENSSKKGEIEYETWEVLGIPPIDLRDNYIKKSPAVTGLTQYKAKLVYAMGAHPVLVTSIDSDGDLNGEPVDVLKYPDIWNLYKSTIIYKLFYLGALNKYIYGFPFVELILNASKNKIIDVNIIDTPMGRWGLKNNDDIIENAYFGDFENGDVDKIKTVPVLSVMDPLQDLIDRKSSIDSCIFPITYSKEYYPNSGWHSAIPWVLIDREAPTYISSFYNNSLGITYIIKVPKIWVDKMWPVNELRTNKQQLDEFDKWCEDLKKELSGSANAHKMIVNESITDENGQEVWITIEQLKSEVKFDKELVTGKMADDKIATAENLGNAVILDSSNGGGMNSGSEKKSQANIDQFLIQSDWEWFNQILQLICSFNGFPENLIFLRRGVTFVNDDKSKSGVEPNNTKTNVDK